jgi:hypothetical protein
MDSKPQVTTVAVSPKRFSSRDIFGIFVVLSVGLLSIGSWQVFLETVLLPDLNTTLKALAWFAFLGTAYVLGTLVWRERLSQVAAPLVLFVPSLLFVQTWYHLVFVLIASLFAYLAIRLVQDEMDDRVRFLFFRNVRAGVFTFVFALSLALSSAYFSTIETESWEELVPRFSLGEGTASIIFKAVASFNPEWQALANDGMTVDDFLLSLEKDQTSEGGNQEMIGVSPELMAYVKENIAQSESSDIPALTQALYLARGRAEVARLTGKEIRGDEKIADVFSVAIQNRIITVLNGEQASRRLSPAIVPFVLTVLLFLTLLPLGSALGILWVAFGFVVFRIGIFFGWLTLTRAPRSQEVLLP